MQKNNSDEGEVDNDGFFSFLSVTQSSSPER